MKNNKKLIFVPLAILIIILLVILLIPKNNSTHIDYSKFVNHVKSGDVVEAAISKEKVDFTLKNTSGDFYTDNPNSTGFKEFLLLNDVSIKDTFSEDDFVYIFDALFYIIFFVVAGVAIFKLSEMFGATKFKVIRKSDTRFSDICGMEDVKTDMTKTVELLKHPEEFAAKGIRAPKGIILDGPPGNGKTLFAKALAGEANINFIPTKGADFQSAVMSVGPSKIKAVFKKARRNKPCIIFIDEFDGIGERRNYTGTGIDKENNRIITAMLNEMDGFETSDGVLVIGATNSYGSLDSALVRPGRFDKKFNVKNPDKNTIIELINMYSNNKVLSDKINIDSLAKCFNGLSCSAVETLMNEAAMQAMINNRNEIVLEDIIEAGRKTNIIKINKV